MIKKQTIEYKIVSIIGLAGEIQTEEIYKLRYGKEYIRKTISSYNEKLDMQMIDMGIALCHFDLTAKENNLNIVFEQNDPKLETDAEYIASYRLV